MLSRLQRSFRRPAIARALAPLSRPAVRSMASATSTFEEKEHGDEAQFFNRQDRENLQKLLAKLEQHEAAAAAAAAAAASTPAAAAAPAVVPKPDSAAALKDVFNKHRLSLTNKLAADLHKWKADA